MRAMRCGRSVMVAVCAGWLAGLAPAGWAKEADDQMTQPSQGSGGEAAPDCPMPLSDAELKQRLTSEQYHILRQNGTEAPFLNAYWNNKHPGLYVDPITGEPLFASLDKYDSKTGWPSFTKPLKPESLVETTDASHGMARTEVRSKSSNSHLGHVFDDGPAPTGMRYCINSAALRFIPVEDLQKEGYSQYLPLFAPGGSSAPSASR